MSCNATRQRKKLFDSVQGRVTTNHKEGAVSKKLMVVALSIVMFSAFATEAWALSFGGGGFRWGTISCDRVVQGIARKTADAADLNVSCTLVIKEILAACRNKGKKSDTADTLVPDQKTHEFRWPSWNPRIRWFYGVSAN